MEQLQIAFAHLKAHRFWYSLGLAVIFAGLVSMGSGFLSQETGKLATALDNSWKAVNEYKSGNKANADWKKVVDERKGVLDQDYAKSHEGQFLAQEKLFVWPKVVNELFKGRPFGANLDEDQNKYIFEYRRACDTLRDLAVVFYDLYVLDKDYDGKLVGLVDVGANPVAAMGRLIRFPTWSTDPTSVQAWLAQEQLWIQHALIRSVRAVNKTTEERFDPTAKDYDGSKAWLDAPIKRLYSMEIGAGAMAQPVMAGENKELKDFPLPADQQPSTSSSASSEPKELIRPRYLVYNEQFRLIPVSLHILVDQAKITEVLGGLANTDFNFTILEVRLSYPQEKVKLPVLLSAAGVNLPGRGAENPLYNCVDMDVYATMRIYQMPASVKERRGLKKNGADASKAGEKPAEKQPEPKEEKTPTPTPTVATPPAAGDADKSAGKEVGAAEKNEEKKGVSAEKTGDEKDKEKAPEGKNAPEPPPAKPAMPADSPAGKEGGSKTPPDEKKPAGEKNNIDRLRSK